MKRFFSTLRKTETMMTVVLMVAFTAVAFLQVTFRVFLRSPLAWSEELCKFLFIWCIFIGAVIVSADDGHFRVDFFLNQFPAKIKLMLRGLSFALLALFSVILVYFGSKLMLTNMTRVSPALGIPMYCVYAIFPISGVLVILHLIEQIWKEFISVKGEA